MPPQPTVKTMARRLARVFREYATSQGWAPDDYRVFVHANQQWGRVHVVLAARQFQTTDMRSEWKKLVTFIDSKLHDFLEMYDSVSFTLRSFSQINEGGVYGLGPEFIDLEDILGDWPAS